MNNILPRKALALNEIRKRSSNSRRNCFCRNPTQHSIWHKGVHELIRLYNEESKCYGTSPLQHIIVLYCLLLFKRIAFSNGKMKFMLIDKLLGFICTCYNKVNIAPQLCWFSFFLSNNFVLVYTLFPFNSFSSCPYMVVVHAPQVLVTQNTPLPNQNNVPECNLITNWNVPWS